MKEKIKKIWKKSIPYLVIAIVSIICFLVATSVQDAIISGEGGLFAFELNLRCPLYFMIGMALNLHEWQNACEWRNLVVAMFLAVVSIVAYALNQGFLALPCIRSLLRFIATLSMAFVVWHFIPPVKWPRFLTGNAFPVFVLHGMILYLLPLPFKALGVWRQVAGTLGPILIAISAICLAVLASVIMKKTFPRFANIIFGGR